MQKCANIAASHFLPLFFSPCPLLLLLSTPLTIPPSLPPFHPTLLFLPPFLSPSHASLIISTMYADRAELYSGCSDAYGWACYENGRVLRGGRVSPVPVAEREVRESVPLPLHEDGFSTELHQHRKDCGLAGTYPKCVHSIRGF